MSSSSKLAIRSSTPELLWHGGGNENGKPDPVFAVDISPNDVLATAGIDASVPPKGSVRLWKINSQFEGQEFIVDLCDHQSAVNVVRFSSCGRMLASASDKQIVIYCVSNIVTWTVAGESKCLERIWLRPSLDEIYDLAWSPDSTHIIAGSIDSKAEIIRIATRDSLMLPGHSSYVQGVAWDPLSQMVATQSADRSVRFHQLKYKTGMAAKLQNRGHLTAKMQAPLGATDNTVPLTAADFGMGAVDESGSAVPGQSAPSNRGKNLFADSTVPSFFRRPSFSPDGALFVSPTGIFRPAQADVSAHTSPAASFCTHIFARDHLSSPIISLVGLEDPSVAVRFSPVLYKPVRIHGEQHPPKAMIPGEFRYIFAVVTVSSVLIYDTQHPHPIARLGGMHWASINDAAWTADGLMLCVCSSDGYITFVRFGEGALGTPLEPMEVPELVKKTLSGIYNPALSTPLPLPVGGALPSVAQPPDGPIPDNAYEIEQSVEVMKSTTAADIPSPQMKADQHGAGGDTTEKKKRRINPVFEGPLLGAEHIEIVHPTGSTTVATESGAPLSQGESHNISPAVSSQPTKIKKRTMPIMVSGLVGCSSGPNTEPTSSGTCPEPANDSTVQIVSHAPEEAVSTRQ